MDALLLVGLIIAVLVLLSKLSETRYQLKQTQHERDVYQKLHEDEMWQLYLSTMPKNYIEDRRQPWPTSKT